MENIIKIMYIVKEIIPNQRAVIDPLKLCNIRCKFCYNLHRDMSSVRPFEDVKKDIDNAKLRGNNYIDVTGGEPTLYPEIDELIKYANIKGMKTCIITNAVVSQKNALKVINAGVDEFLISIHGLEKTHDEIVQVPGARQKQIEFLKIIKEKGINIRFNLVLNRYNQNEIYEIVQWMIQWNPKIINFINMNPHREWKENLNQVKEIVADLTILEDQLNKSIELAESKGIGVNLRYYPMCRIKEEFRRCVCNDFHVLFDPFEWDYCIQPKTYHKFRLVSFRNSYNTELKTYPCNKCDLLYICGGINRWLYRIGESNMISYVKIPNLSYHDKNDFNYYRKNNILTITPKYPPKSIEKPKKTIELKSKLLLFFYTSHIIQKFENIYQKVINRKNNPDKMFYINLTRFLHKTLGRDLFHFD